MRDEWYVARRGQGENTRYGPVPLQELRQLLDDGKVNGDDLVWCEGMANWQRADRCDALFPARAPDTTTGRMSGRRTAAIVRLGGRVGGRRRHRRLLFLGLRRHRRRRLPGRPIRPCLRAAGRTPDGERPPARAGPRRRRGDLRP